MDGALSRDVIALETARLLFAGVETPEDAAVCAEVVADILVNKAEVWGLPSNALVSRVWEAEGERFLEVGPAAGDIRDLFALRPDIEQWALAAGCRHIDISYSRRGWERGLKRAGYEKVGTVMRKQLPWA